MMITLVFVLDGFDDWDGDDYDAVGDSDRFFVAIVNDDEVE